MGFAVRVDVAGAVKIVEVAARFGWSWGPGEVREFARRAGWSAPEPAGTMRRGALFSRTGLGVWWDSAMFWGNGVWLRYIRVTVSDCPERGGFGSAELLADALARVEAAFTEIWGEPEFGAGPAEGPGWVFPNLVAGLTVGDGTVDLLLVNPGEQRYWMERRHEAARRRAAMGGWGRLTEDLAEFVETLPTEARVVITASGGRFVQVAVEDGELHAELSRSEFVDPTWRYGAEVEQLLTERGWSAPGESNWQQSLSRKAGSTAVSGFTARLLDGLRTLGVRATTDLLVDAWVESGEDLDIAPLGIAPNLSSRSQRAEFLRGHAPFGFDIGPLRVDVPGGIEIARAAAEFGWSWLRADAERFAEQAGWRWEKRPGPADRLAWAKTALRVDPARAQFSYDGDRLESVCVTISDGIESQLFDEGVPAEIREQLSAAFTRAVDGFRAEFGTPVHGVLWHAYGPVWVTPKLALGLVAGTDTVELYLVNPAERARRQVLEQQHTARRATEREWVQFYDDLAAITAELSDGEQVVVDAGELGAARIEREAELLRVELDPEAGLGLHPRVKDLMLGKGWLRPGTERAVWRHRLRRPDLVRDCRRYVEFALWPLRTRMSQETVLRVTVDDVDRGFRTPSTGAVGG
ncbi:DUF6301 family protein [Nocardia sp. NPDC051030]|uniref:DUF6301 family protein n=1 Tax=Nocardia sp. NPDC051030 TaxID=3155162 RepID=UPI003423F4EA